MDIRQSSLYSLFMQKIGWQAERIGKWNIFIRNLPLLGKIAKFQRIIPPIPFKQLTNFKSIIIEPDLPPNKILEENLTAFGYKVNKSPYLPTKTILTDLKRTDDEIFKSFHKATQGAIRKAQKNNVTVEVSTNIEAFIKLKTTYLFPIGFLMAKEIRALWKTFYPSNASLLLAPGAGILLLFWEKKAHYWLAASTKKSNQLAAPSLLVWEALKLAKQKGCTVFDFEGIYDERFHNATKNWQGFTKFKQGFSKKELTYIGSFIKTKFPFI